MESTAGKRLQEWREFKGLSLTELFRLTGIKVTTLSTAESAAGSNPSYDTITKMLAAFPDLSADWLLLGKGPMLKDGRALTPAPAPTPATEKPRYTTAAETVEEAGALVKLAATEAENIQLKERLEDAKAEIAWLRGKSQPSSYAAAKEQPRMEIRRWHEVIAEVEEAPKAGGVQRFLQEAEPSDAELAA